MRDFKLVGSLLIFGLMIWFIFIAKVIIIGAVFNATYQKKSFGQIETRRGEIVALLKKLENKKRSVLADVFYYTFILSLFTENNKF